MILRADARRRLLAAVFGLHASLQAGCCDVTGIKQDALPDAVVGQLYSVYLEHNCEGKLTEETIFWSIERGLPPGLSFSSSGKFSGTPTRAGTFLFIVEIGSSGIYGASVLVSKEYTLTVRPAS